MTHSESIVVAVSPDTLYNLVSDVTRVGEWSPERRESWWDEGSGPKVGDWFYRHNRSGDKTWETRSQIVAALRGKEVSWQLSGSYVRWGYSFAPVEDGTELTESWAFLPIEADTSGSIRPKTYYRTWYPPSSQPGAT